MTKVLFFDIDGTLTDTHGGLPEISKNKIGRAHV